MTGNSPLTYWSLLAGGLELGMHGVSGWMDEVRSRYARTGYMYQDGRLAWV